MKAVRVTMISLLKALGNQFLQRITPPLVAAPSPLPTQLSGSQMPRPGIRILPSNPCLDLYFHRPMGSRIHSSKLEFHETLTKQLLPLAWSHDPLTTLKLICNLLDRRKEAGKSDKEAFYAAAFWLHHNHPKTLACNLLPIAAAFGHIFDVLEILSRVLLQGNAQQQVDQYSMTWTRKEKNKDFQSQQYQVQLTQNERKKNRRICPLPPPSPRQIRQIKKEKAKKKASALLKRRKTIATANKAADRYHGDPDYWFLHDRVSDLMAECLKHDIQQFNQHQQQRREREQGKDQDQNEKKMQTLEFNVTSVADCFRFVLPPTDQLLYESVARKVFLPGESDSESEFSNPMSLRRRRRLRKEILVPLRQALAAAPYGATANKWGYDPNYEREPPDVAASAVHKYMVALQKAIAAAESKSEFVSESMIEAGAVLPLPIIRYAENYNGRYERAAELQWKRMVEDVYKKQGRLNNCLAVCDVRSSSESVALGLFVSQLSEGPWEGKVVSYSENPQLHLVRGEDLKSKFSFMYSLDEWDWKFDLGKVFDLILEVAVNENVKADQMVRKVFVFTGYKDFSEGCWKPRGGDYEEIQRKFKEKGYAVPHLVIWNLTGGSYMPLRTGEPGVTLLGGFSEAMLKSFLENDGELSPDQVMELAISPQRYQTLAVFDWSNFWVYPVHHVAGVPSTRCRTCGMFPMQPAHVS